MIKNCAIFVGDLHKETTFDHIMCGPPLECKHLGVQATAGLAHIILSSVVRMNHCINPDLPSSLHLCGPVVFV